MGELPYCGAPPAPEALWSRWNGDPILILALTILFILHWRIAGRSQRALVASGWLVTAFALISPLCALSVSLFSARVGQHMILILVAAPLVGAALPDRGPKWVCPSAGLFAVALWFWHMPVPYAATFRSVAIYWTMHVTLFGSAVLLWRALLHPDAQDAARCLVAGTAASVAMALLGAVLALASHPLFAWHLTTTMAWGFTPLEDQQLGGALMWVPGGALFLYAALRAARRLWDAVEWAAAA